MGKFSSNYQFCLMEENELGYKHCENREGKARNGQGGIPAGEEVAGCMNGPRMGPVCHQRQWSQVTEVGPGRHSLALSPPYSCAILSPVGPFLFLFPSSPLTHPGSR